MEPDPVRIVCLPLPADGGCIDGDHPRFDSMVSLNTHLFYYDYYKVRICQKWRDIDHERATPKLATLNAFGRWRIGYQRQR